MTINKSQLILFLKNDVAPALGCTEPVCVALCALTAVNGAALRVSDGICDETPEDCIRNIARIANPGMLATDREILNIMLAKQS